MFAASKVFATKQGVRRKEECSLSVMVGLGPATHDFADFNLAHTYHGRCEARNDKGNLPHTSVPQHPGVSKSRPPDRLPGHEPETQATPGKSTPTK
jgi:hypothetical protein